YFFFQAEDGIRDFHVTGVQTCALPIFEAADQSTDAPAPAGKLLAHERQRPLLARVRRMRRGAPERSFAIRRSRSASAEAMSASLAKVRRRPSISMLRTPRHRAASKASRWVIISSKVIGSGLPQIARGHRLPAAATLGPEQARRGSRLGCWLRGRCQRIGPDLALEIAPLLLAPAIGAGNPGGGARVDAAVQCLVALAQLLPLQP